MSFRLTEKEAKALHLLAQRDGSKAAALLRRYIRETYRLIFGKEV
jgi:DNA-binding GntR family transcriptional regulator